MIREYIIKVSGEIMDKDEDILDGFPEIVRCKDCKHYNKSENDNVSECMIQIGYFPTTDNWFCADGERRTDDA